MNKRYLQSQSQNAPSARAQILIDAEIDDRLSAGERLTPEEVSQASSLQIQLLRQCGMRVRNGYYSLPKETEQ